MKLTLINSILITVSLIIVNWFLWYVKKKYGRRPSISNSAKYLTADNNQILFYLFITFGICIPLGFIVYNLWAAISAGMLFIIGIVTGYNPKIKDDKLENALHMIFTDLAIVLSIVSILIMNYVYGLIVFIFVIPCLILWLKRVKDHTWRIEVLIIWMIWICLILEQIKNLLVLIINI